MTVFARHCLGLCFAATGALAANASTRPPLEIAVIAGPAAPGAADPVLANAPDGTLWMAWREPGAQAAGSLRCARFGSAAGRWGSSHSIAAGRARSAGPIALCAADGGRLAAAWMEPPGTGGWARSFTSTSADGGAVWSPPVPLAQGSNSTAFPSLAALGDGRVLAVWLEGRGAARGSGPARITTRFVTGPQSAAADWPLADDASPGSPPCLVPLLDGGVLLAYRGDTAAGVRDPQLLRLHGRRWLRGHAISADHWAPDADPGDGPRVTADGGRVAALWLTGAAGSLQLLAATSPDAGTRFLQPARIDTGGNPGPASLALIHDGSVLAVWLETAAAGSRALQLRRLTPGFDLDAATPLGAPGADAAGRPQIAIVEDYAGEATTARALVAFATGGAAPALRTLLLTVPEADLLAAAADDCHCAPTAMQLRGYAMRGTLVAAGPGSASLWETDAIPGVMDAGRHVFQADAAVLRELQPGAAFLARVDRRSAAWWVFDLRRLAAPP